jgi:hypothetical protein
MPANTVNRQAGRDQLVALLQPYLVGSGLPCVQVVGYLLNDFAGSVPAVCVVGGGSKRWGIAFLGTVKGGADFIYQLVAIVPDADPTAVPAYTGKDAEDKLDLIEKLITDCILDHPADATGGWTKLHSDRQSTIVPGVKKGKTYLIETMFVATGDVLDP